MNAKPPAIFDDTGLAAEDMAPEDDLWFLRGPASGAADDLPPGPRAEPSERAQVGDWAGAEASCAARLARVAGRLGALDDRLSRAPAGWRQRLALIEAAELSWFTGDRVGSDRLALWISLRLSGAQQDPDALARSQWAVRRLSGGPGPFEDLSGFLGRRDPETFLDKTDRFEDRAESWLEVMRAAGALHPITRACMGFHLWGLAGLGQFGDRAEAAVTAARVAASDGRGATFAPLAMAGAGGLRATGAAEARLIQWLDGMQDAVLTAMRHLNDVEVWSAKAEAATARLSGRTPPALRAVFAEWPLVSAPMAESLTGASRAAVQRNLIWMEKRGLIREVTGQGRFRMWRIAL